MSFKSCQQNNPLKLSNNLPSTSSQNLSPFKRGLSRRDFLKQSSVIALLAGISIVKPVTAKVSKDSVDSLTEGQKRTLIVVQMQLFPDDGDGPSATDLHALSYLQWALEDPSNQDDGDQAFIVKGLNYLQEQSKASYSKSYIFINKKQQYELLKQIEQTKLGENWMSLLIYYLIEALLLDPIYGGNPNSVSWKWLEHQPGYPRPIKGHTYQDYLATKPTNKVSIKA